MIELSPELDIKGKDYTVEAEKLNPYQKGSCEHEVFKKGFESMYFK